MLKHSVNAKNMLAAGALVGSVITGVASLFLPSKAAAYPLNPCPGIYYEEPFNSTRTVPQGCPPNAATQGTYSVGTQRGVITPTRPAPSQSTYPVQPPLPEGQQSAITTISLANNSFDARVINNTGALVTYEVVGHTQRRYLQGGEEAFLQGIPAPATITFTREDNGFVEVTPVSSAESGLLAIQLTEDATPLDNSQGVLRIQSNGQVLLN